MICGPGAVGQDELVNKVPVESDQRALVNSLAARRAEMEEAPEMQKFAMQWISSEAVAAGRASLKNGTNPAEQDSRLNVPKKPSVRRGMPNYGWRRWETPWHGAPPNSFSPEQQLG